MVLWFMAQANFYYCQAGSKNDPKFKSGRN